MSPNVGNFVHDLVEMAKAMETLPQVQQALSDAEKANRYLNVDIESLKADLEQSRTYAASLEQKVRSLEVERDDASFRVLEAEDKAFNVLAMAKAARVSLDQMTGLLDPPKPQPEPTPEPVAQPVPEVVQSIEAQPQGPSDYTPPQPSSPNSGGENTGQASTQGQGEGNPTAETASGQSPVADQASALSNQNEGTKPSSPYTNTLYHDHPGYVSRVDWLAGGGTDDSYDWRPDNEVRPNLADRSY